METDDNKRADILKREKSWPTVTHGGICLRCAFGWKLHETWQVLFRVEDSKIWKLYFTELDVLASSAKSDGETRIKSPKHVRFQMRQKEKTQNYGFALISL